jgi:cupin 2 domain-containing protein
VSLQGKTPVEVNNFLKLPAILPERKELLEEVLSGDNVTVERIISTGQKSEDGCWMSQNRNELVLLLQGKSQIEFQDNMTINLNPGDYLLISSDTKHRVVYTSKEPPCIWLAIHYNN